VRLDELVRTTGREPAWEGFPSDLESAGSRCPRVGIGRSAIVQVLCRFSDAGNDDLTARSGGRRPKSAKARNRAVGGAAVAARALWGFGRGR
jgi:hypothetical protein